MKNNPDISVVIPVYKSRTTIGVLVNRLFEALNEMRLTHEVVLVDDASDDDTWSVVEEIANRFPATIIAVRLARNYGQHNALMCGFRHTTGNLVATMDDDLQNPPEELLKLIEASRLSGNELTYGQYEGKEHASWRNVGSVLVNQFYKSVFGLRINVTSFRLIRRDLLNSILAYQLNYTFLDGLLAWNTNKIGSVLVKHQKREHGRSGYSMKKLAVLALNLYTNFSIVPLQIVSVIGGLVAFIGMSLGMYYILGTFLGTVTVPGFASVIVSVLFLGGLQLMSLGMIGEYVGRVHLNINQKPQFREYKVINRKS